MSALQSLGLMFAAAFGASVVLTAVVRWAARRLGVLDRPDGGRKRHRGPIPLWGGVAVYLAMAIGLLVARFGSYGIDERFDSLASVVIAAAGVVCFAGCVDDAFRLSPRVKLLFQTLSILPIVLAGYSVEQIIVLGYTIKFGWLGIPVTVLWLMGCINALNLLDGMDGLASVVGISTAATMGVIATYLGNTYVTVVAVVLASALAGFLVHNRPPAAIFLGDSGSMVIGLVVGILGIQSTLKTSATLSITAPLVAMTFPMFDTLLAIVRRRLTGRRFDTADRQHIHHRLLDRGLDPWWVLALLGTLCLATGVAATVATILRWEALAWITALILVIAVMRLRWFGHHELAMLLGSAARGLAAIAARLASASAVQATRADEPLEALVGLESLSRAQAWAVLVDRVRPWNVGQLQLLVADADEIRWRQTWVDATSRGDRRHTWTATVLSYGEDGRWCEIRAAGCGTAAPETHRPGLDGVLKRFASHFIAQPKDTSSEAPRRAA